MAGAIEDAEITFRVNPAVAKALKTTESSVVDELEASLKKDVVIKRATPLFPPGTLRHLLIGRAARFGDMSLHPKPKHNQPRKYQTRNRKTNGCKAYIA